MEPAQGGARTGIEVGVSNPLTRRTGTERRPLWLTTLLPGVLKAGMGEVNKTYGKNVSTSIAAQQTAAQTRPRSAPVAATPTPVRRVRSRSRRRRSATPTALSSQLAPGRRPSGVRAAGKIERLAA